MTRGKGAARDAERVFFVILRGVCACHSGPPHQGGEQEREHNERSLRFAHGSVSYTRRPGGESIELPAKAFELLRVLLNKRGTVVSRDTLIDEVWGADEFINQRTVNNLMVKLRQAIEVDPDAPRYLKTIHGVGYRLDP